jgi:ATP-dependent Clp protease ATP-binding subunit ClpC
MSAVTNLPSTGMGQILISKDIENLFEEADKKRKKYGDTFISTGALFLSFFSDNVPKSKEILENSGLDLKEVKKAYDELRGGKKVMVKDAESKTSVLDEYTTDLTELARKEQVDPVIGREEEIEAVIQIISRRKKNNPILVGEPGVGKTAIVEGLALRIHEKTVPHVLWGQRVIVLDLAGLIAGTKYRGQFEERMRTLMLELETCTDNIVFIDELHTLVGAGGATGSLDAANMFKPALARGDFQIIGATTSNEYRKYIEKDGALERRFQKVMVNPPSIEDTIQILNGIKEKYEDHHQVILSQDALHACVELSERYITDKFLPDKAIDVMDEVGSHVHIHNIHVPEEIVKLEKNISDLRKKKESVIAQQKFEQAADMRDKERKLISKLNEAQNKWDQNDVASRPTFANGIPVIIDTISATFSSLTVGLDATSFWSHLFWASFNLEINFLSLSLISAACSNFC